MYENYEQCMILCTLLKIKLEHGYTVASGPEETALVQIDMGALRIHL